MKDKTGLKGYFHNLPKRLIDEKENKKIVSSYTYFIMACISSVMTYVNSKTDVGILLFVTGIFACCCLLNLCLSFTTDKAISFSRFLFGLEVIVMFTFFIISGNPQGFSIIWTCLVPAISLLFYGRRQGIVMSIVMFLIIIFFLWVPFGQNFLFEEAKRSYTTTFMLRYPFLYLGSFALALILSIIQDAAYNTVAELSRQREFDSRHDPLTLLYNRRGMMEVLNAAHQENLKKNHENVVGMAVMDIDRFKAINDTYGHLTGDKILKEFTELLLKSLNGYKCRYGGDEFVIVWYNNDIKLEDFENFRSLVENHGFVFDDKIITATTSIGVVYKTIADRELNVERLFVAADKLLYTAKEKGANQVTVVNNNE